MEERRLAGYVGQAEANQRMVSSSRVVLDHSFYFGSGEMDAETRERFLAAVTTFERAAVDASTSAVLPTFVGTVATARSAEAATAWMFRLNYRVQRATQSIEVDAYRPELAQRRRELACDINNASRSNGRMIAAFEEDLDTRSQGDYSTGTVTPMPEEDTATSAEDAAPSESECEDYVYPPPL